jgi:hypothetical protein
MNGRLTKRLAKQCETYEAVERQSTLQQTHPILEPPCRQWAVHCGEVKSLIDADSSCEKHIDAKQRSSCSQFIFGQACNTCSRIPGGCLGVPAEVCPFLA